MKAYLFLFKVVMLNLKLVINLKQENSVAVESQVPQVQLQPDPHSQNIDFFLFTSNATVIWLSKTVSNIIVSYPNPEKNYFSWEPVARNTL